MRNLKEIDLTFNSKIYEIIFNRQINFQIKLILIRKLISSWLLGICLKHSQTTNLLICIQFGAYKLILASVKQHFDPISQRRKIRLKMNLKPLYAHKRFDSEKFPCFQRNM